MQPTSAHAAALLADLNEPQRDAVTHRDGPLLVVAGPGSGKTRVITRRAAYLVHTGVPAHNILAITFTNKAADEMRRRIEALGVDRGMWVYTFHAFGARLLREFGALAQVQPGFTIYDEDDSQRVIVDAFEATNVSQSILKPDRARAAISDFKNRLQTFKDCAAQAEDFEQRALARVYEAYQQLLEQRNAVDFDDLIMRVALVLRAHPEITERLSIRFRYVLIDEYQDTNHAQYLIAHHLAQHHGNICATGDPDQSIYAWRGADIRNILEFERDFPNARVVRLEQNYRSTGHILRAASTLIANNHRRKHKDLWTTAGVGEPVRVWEFARGYEEAEQVAATIKKLHGADRPWSDFAIFYRINAVSRGLEEALRNCGIPYRIARGVEFYNRREIRDVVAYLRVLVNPADDVSLLRIINTPARGIGKTTVARLQTYANETRQPISAVIANVDKLPALGSAAGRVRAFASLLTRLKSVLDHRPSLAVSIVLTESGLEEDLRREHEVGGEDRLANVQELVTAATRYETEAETPSLEEFLNRVSLASDQDRVDENAGVVMLMTLHAAKGLEFPVVFLVGAEQGLLPHERALTVKGDVEEERRLCFVGVTRARERLYVSRAAERTIRGQSLPRSPSQFLAELGTQGVTWRDFRPTYGRTGTLTADNFVPHVEDLPPEEAARLAPRRGLRRPFHDEFPPPDAPPSDERYIARDDADVIEPVLRPRHPRRGPADRGPQSSASSSSGPADDSRSFADWSPGTFVQHDRFGVGQVVWLRPGPGQTRACVRFASYGEKTFILEKTPIRKLARRP